MQDSTTQSLTDKDHLINAILKSSVTPETIYRLDSFFEFVPPDELRDNLIELYHNYLLHEHDSLPYNFKQLAEGMSIFLDFLKFVHRERTDSKDRRSEA
jgi:hypothetical protein